MLVAMRAVELGHRGPCSRHGSFIFDLQILFLLIADSLSLEVHYSQASLINLRSAALNHFVGYFKAQTGMTGGINSINGVTLDRNMTKKIYEYFINYNEDIVYKNRDGRRNI